MSVFNGNLNEMSDEQFIITDKDIYRKINGYLYMLSRINNRYVWSANYETIDFKGSEIINNNRLSYNIMYSTVVGEDTPYNFLSIYKADDTKHLTHTTTFNGSYDIPFYWEELPSEPNRRCLQITAYLSSERLFDLSTHIDLTQNCSEEYEHELAHELDGWSEAIQNEGWMSWASPSPAPAPVPVQSPAPAPAPVQSPAPAPEPVCPSEYEKAQTLNGWSNPTDDNFTTWSGPGPSISPEENLRRALNRESENVGNPVAVSDETFTSPIYLEDMYEEERIDPNNSEWYTESEFINYYGDTTEWDYQDPIKILSREKRLDPYDSEWYTEPEFINYYGGYIEWEHQEPKMILLREEYFKFANTFSHLTSKKFIFLFTHYNKTFF